jgi:putative membrane protein
MYVLFSIALLSVYLNLAWDAAGRISPFYYNMLMGAVFTCFALLHGSKYAGRKCTVVLAVLTVVISFIMEYTGVKTGLIYGEYNYGSVLGPKALDTVPWLIPLSWFMFMYVSSVTVDAAFGGRYAGRAAPVLFAMLDSAAMTALDVLIDPLWVTRGTWTWTAIQSLPAGSVFYGIPVQNYFGWLLTSIIIFVPYRIIFFRNRDNAAARDRAYYLPCVMYASIVGVGCIEAWTILSNTGVAFVALMTGGVFSIAALLGFMAYRRHG